MSTRGAMAALLLFIVVPPPTALSAEWPSSRVGEQAAWDAAYDPASGTRFIPMQLVVPAIWDGARRLDRPAASFSQPSGTSWRGPEAWRDPYTGATIEAYDRRRENRREGSVAQKIALRTDGTGIGRVYDSRFGEIVCENEVKFPLGLWRQGETRRFDYDCRTTRDGQVTVLRRTSIVTIDAIDYVYNGMPHSLNLGWQHLDAGTGTVLDHRTYIFVPGVGLAAEVRRH
jgi:hypothetical protein